MANCCHDGHNRAFHCKAVDCTERYRSQVCDNPVHFEAAVAGLSVYSVQLEAVAAGLRDCSVQLEVVAAGVRDNSVQLEAAVAG